MMTQSSVITLRKHQVAATDDKLMSATSNLSRLKIYWAQQKKKEKKRKKFTVPRTFFGNNEENRRRRNTVGLGRSLACREAVEEVFL